MTNILELLKNEKVEWKKFGEVCEFNRGKSITKKNTVEGNIPVIGGGQKPAYYHNESNREGTTITVAGSGAYAGYVGYWEQPIFLSDAFSIHPNDELNKRYLYHWLLENQYKIYELKQGSGIPHVYSRDLANFEIPIPSLETQEKIVEILDKFTGYVTELQSELQSRTKQYTYYRDMLLSEEYLNKITKEMEEDRRLIYTSLGEIGKFTRGNGLQKKDFQEEGKPVIHYGQIYTKYGFLADKVLTYVNDEIFSKLRKAQKNDILIATTSENVEDVGKSVVWAGEDEIGFSGDMYSYRTEQNSKYIAYYFQTNEFQKQKERKVTGTKMIRIHADDMEKFEIPLPPLSLQNKIVRVLDKFQLLLEDTKGLLPEEIEQRQKQYEYYREKLLTFDIDSDSTHARTHARTIISNLYYDTLHNAAKLVGVETKDKVEWHKLGQIFYTKNGYTPSKNVEEFWNNGNIPWFRMEDIRAKGNILYDSFLHVTENAVKKGGVFKKNSIILATSATIGEHALVKVSFLSNQRFTCFTRKDEFEQELNIEFAYYYFYKIDKWCKNNISLGSFPSIDVTKLLVKKMPIPPLHVQQHIVSILDKFDTLVNDIKEGLPKEIEQRQKQYEYWREQLLSFSK